MAFFRREHRAAPGTRLVFERLVTARTVPVGAVVHVLGATRVLSFSVTPADGHLVEVSSRIECRNANPFTWTHAVTRVDDRLHDLERTADMPDPCVPGRASYAIAVYLADKPEHRPIGCTMIDEFTAEPRPAVFAWAGPRTLTWTLDGTVHRRYTVVGDEIASRERGSLIAVRAADEDELLSDASPEVRHRVTAFLRDVKRR